VNLQTGIYLSWLSSYQSGYPKKNHCADCSDEETPDIEAGHAFFTQPGEQQASEHTTDDSDRDVEQTAFFGAYAGSELCDPSGDTTKYDPSEQSHVVVPPFSFMIQQYNDQSGRLKNEVLKCFRAETGRMLRTRPAATRRKTRNPKHSTQCDTVQQERR